MRVASFGDRLSLLDVDFQVATLPVESTTAAISHWRRTVWNSFPCRARLVQDATLPLETSFMQLHAEITNRRGECPQAPD